jgi:hypothetical protein
MLMVSSEELDQLVLEVDFGPEINCGQFVERQYSSWFMADLLVQCPKQVIMNMMGVIPLLSTLLR